MEKKYEAPVVEVIRLETEDVITASGSDVNTTTGDDSGQCCAGMAAIDVG